MYDETVGGARLPDEKARNLVRNLCRPLGVHCRFRRETPRRPRVADAMSAGANAASRIRLK
jgi:hypothetical protein